MFCSLSLLGSIQYIAILSPRKLANVMEVLSQVFELWCTWMDNGLDRQDSFWLKKEAINLNAMHILNSYSVRSLFSNFLYTVKDLTRATLNRSKNKQRQNRNFDLRSSWYAEFSWSIKSTPPILLLYNFMQFGQFIGIIDEEPFNLLCTVDIDVTSSKWLPSSITDLSYHLIQAMWLQNLHW